MDNRKTREVGIITVMRCMLQQLAGVLAVLLVLGAPPAWAALVIHNVAVFDGDAERLLEGASVLVAGNRITGIGRDVEVPEGFRGIDGGGRVLMPGMIDAHSHLSIVVAMRELQQMSWDDIGARMTARAKATLMRGFTSVRDLGGPVMGLKKAIDAGIVPGPRIYPSGAFISQTSGHGDFRAPRDPHPGLDGGSSNMQRLGYYRIVDGPDQVLAAVRENLRNGATQIKIMGSGGVGSDFDPIDSLQFTAREIRAATQAAKDWDTYAAAHLHNAPAILRALENGVLSIDHGSQMTEATMQLLLDKGAYLNPQFGWNKFVMQTGFLTDFQREKARIVLDNIDENIRLIRKYGIEITFNVDAIGPNDLWAALYEAEFTERQRYFSNYEILRQATSVSAGLLALSGRRNPYPGTLGVIAEGAYADLLIVADNPLDDVSVLGKSENILLIMKDGEIYKNAL